MNFKIKHKFYSSNKASLLLYEKCLICNKAVVDLLIEARYMTNSSTHPIYFDEQVKWLNRYSKCLTREQFIIKQIIE